MSILEYMSLAAIDENSFLLEGVNQSKMLMPDVSFQGSMVRVS